MTSTTGSNSRLAAFTLIEIMVVIAIIGLLMALVIPILGKIGENSKVTSCKAQIADICSAIEAYRTAFGPYPKDFLEDFSYLPTESGTKQEQERLKSTAVLILALTHSHIDDPDTVSSCPCRGTGPFFDALKLGDNVLRLTSPNLPDLSASEKDPYRYSFLTFESIGEPPKPGRPAFIFVDPWGNPLVYDEKRAFKNHVDGKPSLHDDYENEDHVGITFMAGGSPANDPAFAVPFLLYSFGPNGVDDTHEASEIGEVIHGDDIGNW
ncbi:MAG: hypothetical protein Kow00107_02430 [Planctomycetota bacterium]